MGSKIKFIQANIGYFELEPVTCFETGKVLDFCKNPVVAWAIEHIHSKDDISHPNVIVYPVSTRGIFTNAPMLHPDGRIELLEDIIFEGDKAWSDAINHLNNIAESRKIHVKDAAKMD